MVDDTVVKATEFVALPVVERAGATVEF